MTPDHEMMPEIERIMASDLPELEKLTQAYRYLMTQFIVSARVEVDLAKAISDKESLVKAQIRLNVMEYNLKTFLDCYQFATGRRVPNG